MSDMTGGQRVLLGVSCDFHDAAAALVVDGRIVAAAEEERFSRRKHDAGLPRAAIEACLRIAGLDAEEVDLAAVYERPLGTLQRYLTTAQRIGPTGLGAFVADLPGLLRRNLLVDLRLERALRELGRRRPLPVHHVEHHRSHAAAAFYPSPFEHAAVLTIDGIGEWATASVGRGSHHRLETTAELRYPDSIGLVYSFVTAWCGFTPNADESKLMGLAPYGRPTFLDALHRLAPLSGDGSPAVDAVALSWYRRRSLRDRRLVALLGGPPRRPGAPLDDRDADLAASVQAYLEDAVVRMAVHARVTTGERDLCLGGGVALNCVANGRVIEDAGFDRVWIQPAAGDAGSAIGAALEVWHQSLGRPRRPGGDGRDAMSGAALGPRATADEVDSWVAALRLATDRFDDRGELAAHVARRLDAGQVVGWFQGPMEFGPRALGQRSILADPRSTTIRRRINAEIKRREDFRPFAPAVLADRSHEWFEHEGESPYMLVVTRLRTDRLVPVEVEPTSVPDRAEVPRSVIPACTHVDGTARLQTVREPDHPELHGLLTAFDALTGFPVLLNTSFNVAGEPIVAGPDDALRTACAAGLDALVVEHHVIDAAELRRVRPADDGPVR